VRRFKGIAAAFEGAQRQDTILPVTPVTLGREALLSKASKNDQLAKSRSL
jgi:hypothetical protein